MHINRQLVLRNKNTNKLRRINSIKFYADCDTYYNVYAYSASWRSNERHLRLNKTDWEFVEFKEIEEIEEIEVKENA